MSERVAKPVVDLSLEAPFDLGRGQLVVGTTVFNPCDEDAVTAERTRVDDHEPNDPTARPAASGFRQPPRTARLTLSDRG